MKGQERKEEEIIKNRKRCKGQRWKEGERDGRRSKERSGIKK